MSFGFKAAGGSGYRDPDSYQGFLGTPPTIGYSAGVGFKNKSTGFGFSGNEQMEGHSREHTVQHDSALSQRTADARALAARIAEEKVRSQKAFEQRQLEQKRFEQRQWEQQKYLEQSQFEQNQHQQGW